MVFSLTIAGVSKQLKAGTLSIRETANRRCTASFQIDSTDRSYRPVEGAEVIILEDGTRIFAGLVDRPTERGFGGPLHPGISTTVNVVDFHVYTERRFVNTTLAAGTLKSQLTTLVNTYLAAYGVTLDAGQVNGPTMPELTYDYKRFDAVMAELMTLTADAGQPFVWEISYTKVLSAYQPSMEAAPFNLVGNDLPEVVGDIEVETSRSDQYANRIILKVAPKTQIEREETFTQGVDTYPYVPQYTLLKHYGYVTHNGIFETLRTPDDSDPASWTFDPDDNSLTRDAGAPSGGAVTVFKFDGVFEGTWIAEPPGSPNDIDTLGIWERVIVLDSIPNDTTGQAFADAELAKRMAAIKRVRYVTWEQDITIGQQQTINVSARNVNGTAVISDVSVRDLVHRLERTVTAVIDTTQTNLGRSFQDDYQQWYGDKGAGGAVTTLGSGGASSVDPAPISYAQTIIVAKSGSIFSSIQTAINSITDNSVTKRYLIWIMPGVYSEQITLKEGVDLRGASKHTVQISHGATDGAIKLANYTQVEDLIIENSATEGHWGIVGANVSHWHIRNVDFLAPFGSSRRGAGIKATGTSWNTGFIEHCVINTYTQTNQGIFLESDGVDLADVTLNDVFVDSFEATTGGSILLNNLIDSQIRDLFCRTSAAGYDLRVTGTSEITLESYFLEFGTSSLEIGAGSTVEVSGVSGFAESVSNSGTLTYSVPTDAIGTTAIQADAVTNAKLANMAQSTVKGRAVGAGTGDPTDLSATQATAILDVAIGDSGAGGTKGLVPAPAAGDTAAGKFLKADMTYAVPSGSGGAPTDAQYVTLATNGTLTNERVLTAGSGITITDGGAGGNVTVAASATGTNNTIRKTTTQTYQSQTTYQNDNAFTWSIGANEVWAFDVVLFMDGNLAADFKVTMAVPSGATLVSGVHGLVAGASTASSDLYAFSGTGGDHQNIGAPSTSFICMTRFSGTVLNGANSGSMTVQHAQQTSTATNTNIYAGSWANAIRIS